jgi:hypothetical protein
VAIATIEFMDQATGNWLLPISASHQPHCPIVPAPYHDVARPETIKPVVLAMVKRANPHPIYGAFMQSRRLETFSRDDVPTPSTHNGAGQTMRRPDPGVCWRTWKTRIWTTR